ncbi:MAG: glycosyltransferase family 4 protein [bacterium]
MKILIASPLFTGLSSIILGEKEAVGMPAVYKFQKDLAARGHEVVMVGPPVMADLYDMIGSDKSVTRNNIKYVLLRPAGSFQRCNYLGTASRRVSNFSDFMYYASRIGQVIKQESPDLIYSAFQLGMIGNYYARKRNLPSVLRAYGTFLGSNVRPGNLFHWSYKWKNITAWMSFKSHYSYLIMTNDGTRGDVAARAFGVPEHKLKFWINGVKKDTPELSQQDKTQIRKKLGFKENDKVIITVSRLEDWKRVDRVIQASPQVISRFPEVKFLIVGDGPEMQNLQNQASRLGTKDHIHFAGFIPHESVSNYIQAANVFVSVYDVSNLGNPILEAMASGMGIVSINDGSLTGVIENGETGILIDKNNIEEELPEAIISMIDEDRAHALGEKAKMYIKNCLESWDQRIAKEINLLESLVN